MKKSHTTVMIVDFVELVVERISNIVMIVTCVLMHNTFMITIARRENTCPIVQGQSAKPSGGRTPLHDASSRGHLLDAVDVLSASQKATANVSRERQENMERDAEVNAKSSGEYTPLHDASQNGNESIASVMLDNGANVNVKDKDGWTPLHYASDNGHDAVISLLLEKGADPTITNNKGKTPLQIAQEKNNQNCVAVFEEFARRQQQEKKQLESQTAKEQEEAKKRLQPQEAVASAKKKKDGSMELELAERSIYIRALAQGNTTLGRIRLMMCGPYGVGKTSIVRSLRGEPFNDEYNPTEGIDAVGRVDKHTLGNDLDFEQASRQWIMKNRSLKSNNVELLFDDSKNRRRQDLQSFVVFPKQSSNSQASNPELKPSQKPEHNGICITIWDFAGQIKYHCMHQMFFRSNCLYLLVLDLQMDGSGRRSSEKRCYWMLRSG
jgi:GTPase SAR1 family protein